MSKAAFETTAAMSQEEAELVLEARIRGNDRAFPVPGDNVSGGMSLLELFVGSAITGILSNPTIKANSTNKDVALDALAIAEAAIHALTKRELALQAERRAALKAAYAQA